jgi:hypothetical protein
VIRWNDLINEEETHARRAQLFELAEAQIANTSGVRPGWWKLPLTASRLLPVCFAISALVVIPFSLRRLFLQKPEPLADGSSSRQFEIALALENQELLKDISLLGRIDLLEDWDVLRDWDENHG